MILRGNSLCFIYLNQFFQAGGRLYTRYYLTYLRNERTPSRTSSLAKTKWKEQDQMVFSEFPKNVPLEIKQQGLASKPTFVVFFYSVRHPLVNGPVRYNYLYGLQRHQACECGIRMVCQDKYIQRDLGNVQAEQIHVLQILRRRYDKAGVYRRSLGACEYAGQ